MAERNGAHVPLWKAGKAFTCGLFGCGSLYPLALAAKKSILARIALTVSGREAARLCFSLGSAVRL